MTSKDKARLALMVVAGLGLAGCGQRDLPPENRCTMYWDYYYNTGLGKPVAARRTAEGVKFDDIRQIVTADPSKKTAVCQKILNDAFPGDPALKAVAGPIPKAQ
ncbi:hypothetical protein [Sphingomonas turrisvirgatae]|uniref:Lipoprotein n=1 Tax=Sphingomonas turrisvirgatae TaxID=1888892 RepID=A0A1E3LTT2_9SPHN|nr:hypothetical protein [Sphingomonas turrisvirgatae]ODP37172.1 hypothetical protein BFL28_02755 [Sphingomonas turrisvirgatae]